MKDNIQDTIILENDNFKEAEQIIKNEDLKNLIKFKLNKSNIEEKDLLKIEEITYDGKNIVGKENVVDFQELTLFPNLRKITLNNVSINEEEMELLKELEEISFINCKIETILELYKVKKLSIKSSELKTISEIEKFTDLMELEIFNTKIDNFEFLKNLGQLKVLKIKNIPNFSLEKINFFLPIEYLSIEGIEKLDLDIIKKYANLNTLSIDMDEEKKWHESILKLKEEKIKILFNDIYEY